MTIQVEKLLESSSLYALSSGNVPDTVNTSYLEEVAK